MIEPLFLTLLSIAVSQAPTQTGPGQQCIYHVLQLPEVSLNIDGSLEDPAWEVARLEDGFTFPWENEAAPATQFRAFISGDALYFSFEVEDHHITRGDTSGEKSVERGDRIEIFLARDASLNEYVSIEIDPWGAVLDYSASYYRDFDTSWDLEGLVTRSSLNQEGYVVEAKIPIQSLEGLGYRNLAAGTVLIAGLFRAEFRRLPDGELEEKWISWCRPDSETPDFHIPSAFGQFLIDESRNAR